MSDAQIINDVGQLKHLLRKMPAVNPKGETQSEESGEESSSPSG
jgi:hypothetical protein